MNPRIPAKPNKTRKRTRSRLRTQLAYSLVSLIPKLRLGNAHSGSSASRTLYSTETRHQSGGVKNSVLTQLFNKSFLFPVLPCPQLPTGGLSNRSVSSSSIRTLFTKRHQAAGVSHGTKDAQAQNAAIPVFYQPSVSR